MSTWAKLYHPLISNQDLGEVVTLTFHVARSWLPENKICICSLIALMISDCVTVSAKVKSKAVAIGYIMES